MNKSKNIIKKALLILYFVILPISFSNRAIYGTWNVFSYPNKVSFHGYNYYHNGSIEVLTGDNKPKYEVSKIIDKITCKKIYSYKRDFMGNGKSVYLYLGSNRYLILSSGGGG
ncbi:hypothetical protein LL037_25165 (plasmid) [Clostridium estertheticum]|uniref:hypothetical protein n=1 Tax=Clostridium estertheticum TaxID=238834 RepID=UPI001C0B680D|nr:hypothetical protein [Clostridium estertheticum]MBU3201797.1 hypothetical protein [Clostridium estertheticum]WAG68191.1 hypothetical protein LL037_25165 [Clostridium estertheticum]